MLLHITVMGKANARAIFEALSETDATEVKSSGGGSRWRQLEFNWPGAVDECSIYLRTKFPKIRFALKAA